MKRLAKYLTTAAGLASLLYLSEPVFSQGSSSKIKKRDSDFISLLDKAQAEQQRLLAHVENRYDFGISRPLKDFLQSDLEQMARLYGIDATNFLGEDAMNSGAYAVGNNIIVGGMYETGEHNLPRFRWMLGEFTSIKCERDAYQDTNRCEKWVKIDVDGKAYAVKEKESDIYAKEMVPNINDDFWSIYNRIKFINDFINSKVDKRNESSWLYLEEELYDIATALLARTGRTSRESYKFTAKKDEVFTKGWLEAKKDVIILFFRGNTSSTLGVEGSMSIWPNGDAHLSIKDNEWKKEYTAEDIFAKDYSKLEVDLKIPFPYFPK